MLGDGDGYGNGNSLSEAVNSVFAVRQAMDCGVRISGDMAQTWRTWTGRQKEETRPGTGETTPKARSIEIERLLPIERWEAHAEEERSEAE